MLLHKYSGRTDRDTPTVIGTYYTLVSILIAFCGVSDNNEVSNITETSIGAVLFAVWIAGNLFFLRNYEAQSLSNTWRQEEDFLNMLQLHTIFLN